MIRNTLNQIRPHASLRVTRNMSLHACRTFHPYVFWMAGYPLAVIIYAVMKKEPGTFGLRQFLPCHLPCCPKR